MNIQVSIGTRGEVAYFEPLKTGTMILQRWTPLSRNGNSTFSTQPPPHPLESTGTLIQPMGDDEYKQWCADTIWSNDLLKTDPLKTEQLP